MALSRFLVNAGVFLGACVASVALAEGVLRLVFNPGDYLAIDPVRDPVLGHRLPGGINGHDANGFRNPGIPEAADILAIGDSMTYGVMAASTESWPAHLAGITGKSVYNAGLLGYGPLQYLHLVRTLAPKLKPERVVVMVTVSNDAQGAFAVAYTLPAWKDYRGPVPGGAVQNTVNRAAVPHVSPPPERTRLLLRLRRWAARRSLLLNLAVTQTSLFHDITIRTRLWPEEDLFAVTHLGRRFALHLRYVGFKNLAVDDPRVVEGLRIAKRALGEIAAFCERENIPLHVALMPAREQVLYPHVRDQLTEPQNERMTVFIRRLQTVTADLTGFLSAEGIAHTDLRRAMIEAFENRVVYPAGDSHPNGEGYLVAAETLAAEMGLWMGTRSRRDQGSGGISLRITSASTRPPFVLPPDPPPTRR